MTYRRVGIITRYAESPFQSLVIEGAQAVASEHEIELDIRDEAQVGAPNATIFTQERVDGVLVIANAAPQQVLAWLNARNIPITLISHTMSQLSIPSVRFNNAQGVEMLVRHMIDVCRRRRLVFVRGMTEQIDAREREAAFMREVMKRAPFTLPPLIINGEFDPVRAVEGMRELVATSAPFDGVFAADYLMAGAIIRYLRDEAAISVPGQVVVCGFGDSPDAEREQIATVSANVTELGRCALLQLLHQLRGHRIRGVTTLSVELRVRQSMQPELR